MASCHWLSRGASGYLAVPRGATRRHAVPRTQVFNRLQLSMIGSCVSAAGLFHEEDWQDVMAFRAAVDRINMDKVILPHVKLVPIVEIVSPVDSFSTGKRRESPVLFVNFVLRLASR